MYSEALYQFRQTSGYHTAEIPHRSSILQLRRSANRLPPNSRRRAGGRSDGAPRTMESSCSHLTDLSARCTYPVRPVSWSSAIASPVDLPAPASLPTCPLAAMERTAAWELRATCPTSRPISNGVGEDSVQSSPIHTSPFQLTAIFPSLPIPFFSLFE
jgi:hypothetical protein